MLAVSDSDDTALYPMHRESKKGLDDKNGISWATRP